MERTTSSGKVLPASFFDRPTIEVARDLLGKWIVSERNEGSGNILGGAPRRELMITEVEAYDGPNDRASHASRGLTPRTKVMFGAPGTFYVYFVYGMHWMANVVTGPVGYPAAVLLRAGMYRNPKDGAIMLTKGPALLTRHLGIMGTANGIAASKRSGLWFEARAANDSFFAAERTTIVASKRIGVDYAGAVWSAKRYNFTLKPAGRRGA